MEIAGVVVQLVECMSPSFARRWKDHRDIYKYIDTLKKKLDHLNSRKRDIESKLATELVKGETELQNEVKNWLDRVEKITEEIKCIEEKLTKVRFFSRAGLGKNITQKIGEAEELHRNGAFPDGLVTKLPRRGYIMPTTTTVGGETTFKRKMEEIWEVLLGDEVTKCGVYGMGGIGKTTALQRIQNRLLEEQKIKFDNVIWVTVSKDSSDSNLQEKIANKLDLDIAKDDDETRAAKLHAKLTTKVRYVLILDDLWNDYDIVKIGIPEPTPQNRCKILVSTRDHNICRLMGCKPIAMELLKEDEAMRLFLDIVGHGVLSIPRLEVTVKQVVKECARLPLAIATLAGGLKDVVDVDEWEIALEELRETTKGPYSDILKILKFSYDRLGDKKLQDCLLYCSLFPEDHPIERRLLIQHLISEGIVEERKTRQSEIKMGQVMLNKLVNACLLNDVDHYGEKCVKMHDLIRDMALQITSENPRFLVKSGIGLTSIIDEETWKDDLAKVSLMNNNIKHIPSSIEPPVCPRLLTFLLSKNFSLSSIANNFFVHMKGLSFLDLSHTGIQILPDSVSDLVTLTALILRHCSRLKYVPSLAKLKQLRKLDLYETGIENVPQGMEMLVQLRYLDLIRCPLDSIPDGVLGKLVNLQHLSLDQIIAEEELANLRKLETFQAIICDVDSFHAYVSYIDRKGGLTNYILQLGSIGDFDSKESFYEPTKIVRLERNNRWDTVESGSPKREGQLLLPKDLESLHLFLCCINTSSLFGHKIKSSTFNLKSCIVHDCNGMEHLISCSRSKFPLLPSLEKLELHRVHDLRGLIRSETSGAFMSTLPPVSFSSLKEILMRECHSVKKLFTFDIALLPNLETLHISYCDQLQELISTTSNDHEEEEKEENEEIRAEVHHNAINVVTLPKLRILTLWDLPQLQSIPVVTDTVQVIQIGKCSKLKRLPPLDREACPSSLQRVRIEDKLWESLEWDHPHAKDAIQPLRQSSRT